MKLFLIHVLFLFINIVAKAQCMFMPIPFEDRIHKAAYVVKVVMLNNNIAYRDKKNNINTLKEAKVIAWLKGYENIEHITIINRGGLLDNRYEKVTPSVQLNQGQEYILLLEKPKEVFVNTNYKTAPQFMVYADMQGAMPLQLGNYIDITTHEKYIETTLLDNIKAITKQEAKQPSGSKYLPVAYKNLQRTVTNDMRVITAITPNPAFAGTVDVVDRITITGSGFGTYNAGTSVVSFANADDGGSTFIDTDESDIISWNNTTIVTRVPPRAGTGNVVVGSFTSPMPLTIDYGHTTVFSSFSGFSLQTNQRYYHRNINGSGGYSFQYSTLGDFADDAAAIRSFERALSTWRCATGINWNIDLTTTNAGDDADGINAVFYDNTLPNGALGYAVSRFSANATGTCNLFNTVWYLDEVDVGVAPVPFAGFTWNTDASVPANNFEFDMETLFLHEMGHASGLEHRIAPGDLMHFAISNGQTDRTPAPQEITGVTRRMNYSALPATTCFNPAGSGTPMTLVPNGVCTLDFLWLEYSGKLMANGLATLVWKASKSLQDNQFILERSNNGVAFEPVLYNLSSNNNFITLQNVSPLSGTTYYRLMYRNANGQILYSPVIKIVSTNIIKPRLIAQTNRLQVYSPVKDEVSIYDVTGKLLYNRMVQAGAFEAFTLTSKGVYIVKWKAQQYVQKYIAQ
jgi:hypothetical protein